MSGDAPTHTTSSPVKERLLAGLFGVVMFVSGVFVGNLVLPTLLDGSNATPVPTATLLAQVPPTAMPTSVTTEVVPTATSAPPTATMPPPTPTVPMPTATIAPPTATPTQVPTPTATRPPSSVFAPEPTPAAAEPTGTANPAATGTVGPTATSAIPSPTVTPTATTFVATHVIDTDLPVNFRSGPGTIFPSQGALPPGTLLAATGNTQTTDGVVWVELRNASGTLGWVRAQDIAGV